MNDLIMKAAQYMDEHGKAVGVLRDNDGAVCMAGALEAVSGRLFGTFFVDPELRAAYTRLNRFVHNRYPFQSFGVEFVSDHLLETKEETVKFMMEAAEWEPES